MFGSLWELTKTPARLGRQCYCSESGVYDDVNEVTSTPTNNNRHMGVCWVSHNGVSLTLTHDVSKTIVMNSAYFMHLRTCTKSGAFLYRRSRRAMIEKRLLTLFTCQSSESCQVGVFVSL